jgi:hypothetical protein
MSLLDTVRDALTQGWNSLGDLRQTVTIQRIMRGAYNTTTGATANTILTATPPAILTSHEAEMIDGTDIRVGDLRCIILGKDMSFRPEQGDSVTLPNGQVWRVMRAAGDLYDPPIYHDLTLRR